MSDAWISDLSLVGIQRLKVRSLAGFRKGHRVPDEKSAYTDGFVGRIAEADLQDDLEARFQSLKQQFGWKRTQIVKDGPTAGAGQLATPAFDYLVRVEIDPADTSQFLFERRVCHVKDLAATGCGEFDFVFAGVFDSAEIVARDPIDVEAVIDAIEDADPPELILDYNADATECRVQPRGTLTRIVVTAESLLVQDGSLSASTLLQAAASFRARFVDEFGPWSGTRSLM